MSIPTAVTRAAAPLPNHQHPLFRSVPLNAHKFAVAAGNNAAPTTKSLGTFTADMAGLYLAILVTGNNTSFAMFRLDNGGTVTVITDSGAVFVGTPTDAKVAISVVASALTITNRIGAGSAAAAVDVTLARLTTE